MTTHFVKTLKINDYSDVTVLFGLSLKNLNKNMMILYPLLNNKNVFSMTLHDSYDDLCNGFKTIDDDLDVDDFYVLVCKENREEEFIDLDLSFYKQAERDENAQKKLQAMYTLFLKDIKNNSILGQL